MPTGVIFYSGPYAFGFDSEQGVFWKPISPPDQSPRPNALVASEETVMNYLREYGVKNVKGVKLVEVKFPKNLRANHCNSLLRRFAERLVEQPHLAKYYHQDLLNYCGVDIDYDC